MPYKIPIELIELEDNNYHILIKSEFENGEKVWWVVDTGASKTVFDKNLSEHISDVSEETEELHAANKSDEPLRSSLGLLKAQKFGPFKVEELKVALLDLAHINDLYRKATDRVICGLLGGDFLVQNKAIIDYKKLRLIVSK